MRVVAQEGLDVAHYITDMTAQFEAMAIAARLDLLAYFLGMARAESELFVRTNAVAEAEARSRARTFRRARISPARREQFVRLKSRSAHLSSAIARKATRSPENSMRPASSSSSSATRTSRAEASAARAEFVERYRRRAEQRDDALARGLGSSPLR